MSCTAMVPGMYQGPWQHVILRHHYCRFLVSCQAPVANQQHWPTHVNISQLMSDDCPHAGAKMVLRQDFLQELRLNVSHCLAL